MSDKNAIVLFPLLIVNSSIKQTCAPTFQNNANNNTWEEHRFVFSLWPPMPPLLFSTPSNSHCPIFAQSPWVIFTFLPKIPPNLFEASLYLSSLSGRLVCSVYTQLCIPALKATSSQMPVLARDYLSNALWLVHIPRQNHSCEMKLDRLL